MRIIIFSIFTIFIFILGCKEMANMIDPGEEPIISSEGIVVDRSIVYPGDVVVASISAENPQQGPLTYAWSRDCGEITSPPDNDTISWVAPYPGGKTCYLHVNVSNSYGDQNVNKPIVVKSLEKPLVDILKPAADEYYLLYQSISVEVNVKPPAMGNIDSVKVYINTNDLSDQLIYSFGSSVTRNYKFNFNSAENMVGVRTLKVLAYADNGKVGLDNVKIHIGGVVPGGAEQE